MIVIDDFLSDFDIARNRAMDAAYIDWSAPDGEVYKRIFITDIPGVKDGLEKAMGPIEMLGMGYRLNYAGELPNQAIHTDLGWGTHAMVLYLCDGEGGTAFWRHKASQAISLHSGDVELFKSLEADWNSPEAWEQIDLCPIKKNRAVIYESTLFHSRWPFEAFGSSPQDGRLTAVAFFSIG